MAENEQPLLLGDTNKCSICLETCQELKKLKCQHSFCLLCLQKWMTRKGALECPNCRQTHSVPVGGLRTLPSNAMEFKSAKQFDRLCDINIKCCCGNCNADFYCKDCSQYLCTTCKNTHEKFPALKNHILQPISAMPPSTETLHKNLCPLHEKELEFYCKVCKTPICQKCAITDHSEYDGQHKPIRASEAFNDLRRVANALMAQADFHKHKAQAGISKCTANASELSKRRNDIMKDINQTVEEIIKFVRETEIGVVGKLEDICKAKNRKSNSQIDELKSTISDIEGKQNHISTLLKSGDATDLNTCHQIIKELQDIIAFQPETDPRDDGKVYFSPTKDNVPVLTSLKKLGIGHVSEKPNENIFEIVSENPMTVTCYQPFHVVIDQKHECEIDMNDLKVSKWEMTASSTKYASMKYTSSQYTSTFRIVKSEGKYFVKGTSSTDLTLDVKFCNSSIKGSPIKITVQPAGIVKRITNVGRSTRIMGANIGIQDLMMSDNGWFLVVCNTNEVFRFGNTGAFISTIKLPSASKVQRIYKLKNNNLIFLDWINCNITICKQDGQLIKSTSTGQSSRSLPSGIAVNEELDLMYIADQTAHCIYIFNMASNLKIETFGSKGRLEGQMNGPSGIAVTKEGNLIVADIQNHRVQLFGSDGQFIKVLIGGGDGDGMVIRPSRVGVDYDDNIIVVSECKVQLFDKHGKFLRVIYQIEKGEKNYFAISIVSHFPRRLALAKVNSVTMDVQVINY